MPPPDPTKIHTRPELAAALRSLKGDKTYEWIEATANALSTTLDGRGYDWSPETLPKSTVAEWLNRDQRTVPGQNKLLKFLYVFEVPPAEWQAWIGARDRVVSNSRSDPSITSPGPVPPTDSPDPVPPTGPPRRKWKLVVTVVILLVIVAAVSWPPIRRSLSGTAEPGTTPSAVTSPTTTESVGPGSTISPGPGVTAGYSFDFDVIIGGQYDLDIQPGAAPLARQGVFPDSPLYQTLDLYRTTPAQGRDQISGVSRNGEDKVYNTVQMVGQNAQAATCTAYTGTAAGGNVKIASMQLGSKICVATNDNNAVLLEVLQLPAEENHNSLGLHATIA